MWTQDDFEPSAAAREPAAEFSFSSPSFRSSASRPSSAEVSRRSDTGRASEPTRAGALESIPFPTAERLYRVLGAGRAARPGDVLLRPELVSPSTLRRWRQRGWIEKRERPFLTRNGWASLPERSRVVAFAAEAGRPTLFL